MNVQEINGYTVITDPSGSDIINIRAIVGAGSAHEAAGEVGTAHFLEHLFFKGTQFRTHQEIKQATARLGDVNAYTSYNCTVFTLSCLARDFEQAIDVLCEMLFSPRFDPADFEAERTVILQEIESRDSTPNVHFFDRGMASFLGPAYKPVIGTSESIKQMQLESLVGFRRRNYDSRSMAIAVIGNIPTHRVADKLRDVLQPDNATEANCEQSRRLDFSEFRFQHSSEQAFLAIISEGLNSFESRSANFADDVLYNGLGDGMHSLLFRRIRDELGLSYEVCAFEYLRSAIAFAKLDERHLDLAREEIEAVVGAVCKHGFSIDLLETAKRNVMFHAAKGTETNAARGSWICDRYFEFGYVLFDTREFIEKIERVDNAAVIDCAGQIFGGPSKIVTMTHGEIAEPTAAM